jgi:predicted RND superfamily exporter protein
MVRLYRRLDGDLEALLPASAAPVKAVRALRERFPGTQHLGIVVTGAQPGAAAAFAARLATNIAGYPSDLVRLVRVDVSQERAFFRDHAALFLSLDDVREIRRRIDAHLDREQARENPLFVSLDEEPASLSFDDIEARYEDPDPFVGRFPDDRLVSGDGHTAVVLVFAATTDTGTARVGPLMARVRADLAALNPAAQSLEIGYAGDVAITVEELDALRSDLLEAGALVVGAVGVSIMLFFRWWPALVALVVPLGLGTAYAFGLASLRISGLNTSTAFLGSIVIGNGINPGIMLLARYREERSAAYAVPAAIERAVLGTWRGTMAAALAAGCGYLSLVLTTFRGFNQFAIIGGLGALGCWAAAYLLMPPLLSLLDRSPDAAPKPARAREPARFTTRLAAHPRAVLILTGVLLVPALVVVTRIDGSFFEHDMAKLRRRDSVVRGEAHWGRIMNEVLGRNFTALVFLANNSAEVPALETRLRAAIRTPPLSLVASRVVGPRDLVPSDQAAILAELKAVTRRLTPAVMQSLPDAERSRLSRFVAASEHGEIRPEDLPPLLAQALRERDGTWGRTLIVEQAIGGATWDGRLTVQSVATLEAIAHTVSPPAQVAGGFVVSASVLDAVEREAPRITLLVFAAVAVVVALTFRHVASIMLVMGSLFTGVALMTAVAVVTGQRVNALNFVAFPITFGIGAEYAMNVLQRLREPDGDVDSAFALQQTGSAVALCSLTTIIGYGSLLLAENQALFSFGVLAVLGEITCLGAAVVVLPATTAVCSRWRVPSRFGA